VLAKISRIALSDILDFSAVLMKTVLNYSGNGANTTINNDSAKELSTVAAANKDGGVARPNSSDSAGGFE